MENVIFEAKYHQSIQKYVSLTVAHLNGTKREILIDNNSESEEVFLKNFKKTEKQL